MELGELIEICLKLPEVEESTPFGPDVLVFKVCGKMFALTDPDEFPGRVNLKCDPDEALELRDQYEAVIPGYHMNKKHWNTVILDGSISADLVHHMVLSSYRLVVGCLKKADKERLKGV